MGVEDSVEAGVAATSAGADDDGVAGDGRAVLNALATWSLTILTTSSILTAGAGAEPEKDLGASEAPGEVPDKVGGSMISKGKENYRDHSQQKKKLSLKLN